MIPIFRESHTDQKAGLDEQPRSHLTSLFDLAVDNVSIFHFLAKRHVSVDDKYLAYIIKLYNEVDKTMLYTMCLWSRDAFKITINSTTKLTICLPLQLLKSS